MIKIEEKKVKYEPNESAYKITDQDVTLPDIPQGSYPDFLSGIYVEQTNDEQSKYPMGESINEEQFTVIKTLFDNFYKYFPPSRVLDKAVAAKLEHLSNLKTKGLLEQHGVDH